jgi:hypothetical protein
MTNREVDAGKGDIAPRPTLQHQVAADTGGAGARPPVREQLQRSYQRGGGTADLAGRGDGGGGSHGAGAHYWCCCVKISERPCFVCKKVALVCTGLRRRRDKTGKSTAAGCSVQENCQVKERQEESTPEDGASLEGVGFGDVTAPSVLGVCDM